MTELNPLPAAPTAPRGSEKYLLEIEDYAVSLENKIAELYTKHHVLALSAFAFVAGFCTYGIFFG